MTHALVFIITIQLKKKKNFIVTFQKMVIKCWHRSKC